MPAARATADTLAPGSSDVDTSCCFSAELQHRRRSTEVANPIYVIHINAENK